MSASSTVLRRPLIGVLLIVSGALLLLSFILALVAASANSPWFFTIAALALALAYLFLALSKSLGLLLRIALIVAAVGWAIIFINGLVALPALATIAHVLALVGGLVAGILIFMNRSFTRRANLSFLIAAILSALLLLSLIVTFPAILVTIVTGLFGLAVLLAGLFLFQRK